MRPQSANSGHSRAAKKRTFFTGAFCKPGGFVLCYTAAMTKGSCLCGAVSFELDDAGILFSVACYCTNCRKVSGSQFGVYLQVRPESFRWLAGEDQVGSFESSPGNRRGFCRTCGSIAPIRTSYGVVRVPGGALDDDPGASPDVSIFVSSKAGWCAVGVDGPTFPDSGPPEFWRDRLSRLGSLS